MPQDRIHVVLISSWYPNKYQPFVGNFVQRQAELLARVYDVTVVHTVSHPSETEFHVEKKSNGNLTELIVYHPRGKSAIGKFALQRKALKYIIDEVPSADLLISHVLLPKGLQFFALRKELKCPWIHIEHGSYFQRDAWKSLSFLQKTIIRRTMRQVEHLYAVSETLKREILAHFPQKEIGILPNHIDIDLFQLTAKEPSTKKRFLHVSTLEEKTKNPQGMIDACKILVDSGFDNFHFNVISDEPTQKWADCVKELKLENQITFDGPFNWEELPRWYQESDAFIMNSHHETFSIVVAESWATGTPVISTPVGIASKLHKDLGIQIESDNPTSLAQAMESIIKDEKSYDHDLIRASGAKYSGERVLEQLQEIISKHVD